MENIKKIDSIKDSAKGILASLMSDPVKLYLVVGIIFLVILIWLYISSQISKKSRNDNYMSKDLEDVSKEIVSFEPGFKDYKYKLRDYYIMSSYNTCANGDFNNSYVSYNALKKVIKTGARFLDFEIYSVNGKTVVASSSTDNIYEKGSYNSLPFKTVMEMVKMYAFAVSTSPSHADPLILHFRIKSRLPRVYEDMSKVLKEVFSQYRLPKKYEYQFNDQNIFAEPLSEFRGKVMFICDKTNEVFTKSGLNRLINATSGSQFLKKYRNYDVEFTHNYRQLMEGNKKNGAITMPDSMVSSQNMNSALHMKYGCQMICMNFQNKDANLEYYLDMFNKSESAFILKPEDLRYTETLVAKPKAQTEQVSFANKEVNEPYFSAVI